MFHAHGRTFCLLNSSVLALLNTLLPCVFLCLTLLRDTCLTLSHFLTLSHSLSSTGDSGLGKTTFIENLTSSYALRAAAAADGSITSLAAFQVGTCVRGGSSSRGEGVDFRGKGQQEGAKGEGSGIVTRSPRLSVVGNQPCAAG